jgi:hypothetical protein
VEIEKSKKNSSENNVHELVKRKVFAEAVKMTMMMMMNVITIRIRVQLYQHSLMIVR